MSLHHQLVSPVASYLRQIVSRLQNLGCALLVAIPALAHGAILYDSAGFEPPRFVLGANLQGQDAPPLGQGPWFKDFGSSSAVLQSAVVAGGAEAVQITRTANTTGDTRWAVTEPFTPSALENIIRIDVDLRVEQASFTPFDFGPAFGIEAYDGTVAGNVRLIGSLTLDARTGDVLYQAAGTGVLMETGTVLARGTFHHFTLMANFTNKTYSVFANGLLLRTEGFVDNDAAKFTDAPLATFAASGSSIPTATGTAYFDNYTIASVPEPGSVSLLCAATLFIGVRRQRLTGAN